MIKYWQYVINYLAVVLIKLIIGQWITMITKYCLQQFMPNKLR